MKHWPVRFEPLLKATYFERPNRFLLRCRLPGKGIVNAFLPNPGRLWELLMSDAVVYLTPAPDTPAGAARKTRYTAVAIERDGEPVFLHTHATNQVARYLIERKMIPALVDAEIVRSEVTVGRSRFDLLLRRGGKDLYVEVKSCTLFGNRVGMFPDAITARGRRHMLELAEMNRRGIASMVLIIVQNPHLKWFMPDYHTDLEFSRSMLSVRHDLPILPLSIGWNRDLSMDGSVRVVDVPWDYLEREVDDRGAYLVIMELRRKRKLRVGQLGEILFEKGHYAYIGSAMANLSARIARHRARRKKLHWHIDYLRQHADIVEIVPIRSSRREECDVAAAFSRILTHGPTGFGSSDCDCPTHLLYSEVNPLTTRAFHDTLESFRMRWPDAPHPS
jgi:sugar fermentation stimulation protein A